VRFPDFPGIVIGGYSLEEAIKNAQEALELTMDTMNPSSQAEDPF